MPRRKQDSLRIEQGIRPAASPVSGYSAPRLPRRRTDRLESLSVLSRSLSGFLAGKERQQEQELAQEGNTAGASAYNDTAAQLDAAGQDALAGNRGAFNKLISQGAIPALGSPYAQQNFDRKAGSSFARQIQSFAEQNLVEWTQIAPGSAGGESGNVSQQLAEARQSMLQENPILLQSEDALQAFEEDFAAVSQDIQSRANRMLVERKDTIWKDETRDSYLAQVNGAVEALRNGDPDSLSAHLATVVGNVEDDHSDGLRDSRALFVEALEAAVSQLEEDDDSETALALLDNAAELNIGGVLLGDDANHVPTLSKLENRFEEFQDKEDTRWNADRRATEEKELHLFRENNISDMIALRGNAAALEAFIDRQADILRKTGDPFIAAKVKEMELWRDTLSREGSDDPSVVRGLNSKLIAGDLTPEEITRALEQKQITGDTAFGLYQQSRAAGSQEEYRKGYGPWDRVVSEIGSVNSEGLHRDVTESYSDHRYDLEQVADDLWSQAIAESKQQDDPNAFLRGKSREIRDIVRERNKAFTDPIRQGRDEALTEINSLERQHQDATEQIQAAHKAGYLSREERDTRLLNVAKATDLSRWTSNSNQSAFARGQLDRLAQSSLEFADLQEDDPESAELFLQSTQERWAQAEEEMIRQVLSESTPGQASSKINTGRRTLLKEFREDLAGAEKTEGADATAEAGSLTSEAAEQAAAGNEFVLAREEVLHAAKTWEREHPNTPYPVTAPDNIPTLSNRTGSRPAKFYDRVNEYRAGEVSREEVVQHHYVMAAAVFSDELKPEDRDLIIDSVKVFSMTPEQIVAGKVFLQKPTALEGAPFKGAGARSITVPLDAAKDINPYVDPIWPSMTSLELDLEQRPEFVRQVWKALKIRPEEAEAVLKRQRSIITRNTPKR